MAEESITAASPMVDTRKREESVQPDLPTTEKKKKKKRKEAGFLGRVWNGMFGGRGEDYEKRLQYLSKEEAIVHARMKRRAQRWRKMARNVILCSVLAEVAAVVYAVLTTRSLDLSWQMRALRVLPMFAFPGVSYVIYSTLGSYTKMRDRKDQKTLEGLLAERQDKINELKEKTNYYTTQQLIQRYDLDPAAKVAAATVLASKLGADSGLKVFLEDESKSISSSGKSNDVEVVPSDGLRNRKNPIGRGHSTGSSVSEQYFGDETTIHEYFTATNGQDTASHDQRSVEHYKGLSPIEGGWISRLAAMLVGEDPSQSYALICGSCHMHNGLARKEDFSYITYYCPHCHALNGPQQSEENKPNLGSLSACASPAPGDVLIIHGKSSTIEAEGSGNQIPVQEQSVEAIIEKDPSEMAEK